MLEIRKEFHALGLLLVQPWPWWPLEGVNQPFEEWKIHPPSLSVTAFQISTSQKQINKKRKPKQTKQWCVASKCPFPRGEKTNCALVLDSSEAAQHIFCTKTSPVRPGLLFRKLFICKLYVRSRSQPSLQKLYKENIDYRQNKAGIKECSYD